MTIVSVRVRILPRLFFAALLLGGASAAHAETRAQARLCMARTIYVEARGEPLIGQLLVGHSIKRRLELGRPGWGGRTICGVVYAKVTTKAGKIVRQYSGITEGEWEPTDLVAWRQSLKAADMVLSGSYTPFQPWRDAVYYLEPTTSSPEALCWFTSALVEVGWFGRHLFFREPASDMEKLLLKTQEPSPECKKISKIA